MSYWCELCIEILRLLEHLEYRRKLEKLTLEVAPLPPRKGFSNVFLS